MFEFKQTAMLIGPTWQLLILALLAALPLPRLFGCPVWGAACQALDHGVFAPVQFVGVLGACIVHGHCPQSVPYTLGTAINLAIIATYCAIALALVWALRKWCLRY
jgi:hypothetical protein